MRASDISVQNGGCRFADRCPSVMDVCRTTEPASVLVDDRLVKCHLYAQAA
jgi:ABC-type dipeptide/oligopeptide/nickel transport system ATPase component